MEMENTALQNIIFSARALLGARDYRACERLVREAMGAYPDDAVPHNLMGLLCESKGDHLRAMKHFRAAWALDPTYVPALKNLDSFSSVFSCRKDFVFDESDCAPDASGQGR